MDKSKQLSIKATVKAIEQDYKTKVKEADKKYNLIRKEAEAEADREKALIKARKEKIDRESKEEYQLVKQEAGEVHTRLVLDLVKNVILDIKATNLAKAEHARMGDLHRSNSVRSSASGSSCNSSPSVSNIVKEDAEIKEWVEYAAERLEMHMSKSQVRQRLLEEIASGALQRQYQAQQEAHQRTVELQRQVQQLQLLQQHQQHQQQQQGQQQPQSPPQRQQEDLPPPAYVPTHEPAGVNEADFAVYGDLKKK
ncbi:hypothetical protein EMPS_05595 [Entomortierella parvispora]|uniref:Uncharacterized protein n=1 Tax=Entomortierella parvispora TaxID=205924 RepID=A0A9P3LWN1_9FUNG|nr:hypothetical protein EMPS_05595 [Entomortierella parvispora]